MGCTTGKPNRKYSQSNDIISNKPKLQHNQGSILQTSISNGQSNNAILEFSAANSKKNGGLQVDFINDPNQTDQITAKISRNKPNAIHKRSMDQYCASPLFDQPKLAIRKKQTLPNYVGTVQEKSEFEEQGTNRLIPGYNLKSSKLKVRIVEPSIHEKDISDNPN